MADADLRLPPHFPRVPKPCKDVAAAFFECFSREAEYDASKDPGVARAALVTCRDLLPPYAACVDKHLTAKQRELVAVPQFYKEQTLAAAEAAAQPPGGGRK